MSKKVKQLIDEALSTLDKYKLKYKYYKEEVQNQNGEVIKQILDTTEYALRDPKVAPLIKLNSVRLLKEAVDTQDFKIVQLLQKGKILQYMFEIAKFDAQNNKDDRGAFYFD